VVTGNPSGPSICHVPGDSSPAGPRDEVEALNVLARAPRGSTAAAHHGLAGAKKLLFADQVQVSPRYLGEGDERGSWVTVYHFVACWFKLDVRMGGGRT